MCSSSQCYRHLSGSAFCMSIIAVGVPEQALGWFPLGLIKSLSCVLDIKRYIIFVRLECANEMTS